MVVWFFVLAITPSAARRVVSQRWQRRHFVSARPRRGSLFGGARLCGGEVRASGPRSQGTVHLCSAVNGDIEGCLCHGRGLWYCLRIHCLCEVAGRGSLFGGARLCGGEVRASGPRSQGGLAGSRVRKIAVKSRAPRGSRYLQRCTKWSW